MKKLLAAAGALAVFGFAATASADDHAYDLEAACEAYKADHPESKTDCACLAKKAEGNDAAMAEFEAFTGAEGEELGENAGEVVAACQMKDDSEE